MSGNHTNDDAAAGVFTFVLLFFLCGILFLLIGFGVDKLTMMASGIFTGVGESQLRFTTVDWMIVVFRAEPLIMLILIGYNFWISEMRINSSMADTGTMIVGAAEMLTMTFILIAFTLYGGYALDNIVNFVNKFPIMSPDLSLYAAVQYITPCFYGIMFLVLIGVIVQFAMTCTKVIDYSIYNNYY